MVPVFEAAKLVAAAKKAGDHKLQQQMMFLAIICKSLQAWQAAQSKRQASLGHGKPCACTPSNANELIAMDLHLAELIRLEPKSIAPLFEKAEDPFHLDVLDGKVDALGLHEAVKIQVMKEDTAWRAAWCDEVKTMAQRIQDSMPSWHHAKDRILEDQDVLKSLLTNPHYDRLCQDTSLLAEALETDKKFHKTKVHPLLPVTLKTEGNSAVRMGVETSGVTYACGMLPDIAKIANIVERKRACEALRKEVEATGISLGVSILNRMEQCSRMTPAATLAEASSQ